jgi:hypothetical protein
MSKKKKHNNTLGDDCNCDDCSMRCGAYNHLGDTAAGLVHVYAARYEVEEGEARYCVMDGLMDALAEIVVEPAMGMPDEKKILAEMIRKFRDRVEEIRQDRAKEITDAAVEAQAELN